MKISKVRLNQLVEEALASGDVKMLSFGKKMEKLKGKNKIAVQFVKNRDEINKQLHEKGLMLIDYSFIDERGIYMGAICFGNHVNLSEITFIQTEEDPKYMIIKVKPSDLIN